MIPSIIKTCLISINFQGKVDSWLNYIFSLLAGSSKTKQKSKKNTNLSALEGNLSGGYPRGDRFVYLEEKPVFAMVLCQKSPTYPTCKERSYIRVFFPSSFVIKNPHPRAFFFIKYVQFFILFFFSLAGLLNFQLNKKRLPVAVTKCNIFLSLAGIQFGISIYPKRLAAVDQSASAGRTGLQAPLSLDEPPNKIALPIWWGERDKPGVWGVAKGEGGAPL